MGATLGMAGARRHADGRPRSPIGRRRIDWRRPDLDRIADGPLHVWRRGRCSHGGRQHARAPSRSPTGDDRRAQPGREGGRRHRRARGRSPRTPTSRPRWRRVDKDYVGLAVVRTRAQLEAMVKQMGGVATPPARHDPDRRDDPRAGSGLVGGDRSGSRTTRSSRRSADARRGRSARTRRTGRASCSGTCRRRRSPISRHTTSGRPSRPSSTKFRALPETKPAFDQVDQVLSILGGFDAVVSAGGATSAVVISPTARRHDRRRAGHQAARCGRGRIGSSRRSTASSRSAAARSGVTSRTRITTGRRSRSSTSARCPGMGPPGPAARLQGRDRVGHERRRHGHRLRRGLRRRPSSTPARATRSADEPGSRPSSAGSARRTSSSGFVDIAAHPRARRAAHAQMAPAAEWTNYEHRDQAVSRHLDAAIQAVRKDRGLDLGSGFITVR